MTENVQAAPSDPDEINPKIASDIQYWVKEVGVTRQALHEAIRVHGTHVKKVPLRLRSLQYNAGLKIAVRQHPGYMADSVGRRKNFCSHLMVLGQVHAGTQTRMAIFELSPH